MKKNLFIFILLYSASAFSQFEINEATIFDLNTAVYLVDEVAYLPLYAKGVSAGKVAITNQYIKYDPTHPGRVSNSDSICMDVLKDRITTSRYYIFTPEKTVSYSVKRVTTESNGTRKITRYGERRIMPRSEVKSYDTSAINYVKESPVLIKEYIGTRLTKHYVYVGDTLKVFQYDAPGGTVITLTAYLLDKHKNVLLARQFQKGKKTLEVKNTFNSEGLLVNRIRYSFSNEPGTHTSVLSYNKNGLLEKQLTSDNLGNKAELTYSYILDEHNDWKEATCIYSSNYQAGPDTRITRKTLLN